MASLESVLVPRHGVAHLRHFLDAGFSPDAAQRAVRAGRLLRVRRGIYSSLGADSAVVKAARIGGRLAGVSAAGMHGLWLPPRSSLTVEVSRWASHLRDPDDAGLPLTPRSDVRVLWCPVERPLRDSIGVVPLLDCLRQVVMTMPEVFAIAVLDSALRTQDLGRIEWEGFIAGLPPRCRVIARGADRRAESGTESIVRVLLARAGIVAILQAPVPLTDLDRFDLLVGDRLVIECDSEKHHGGRDQRLRDLERDAQLTALGFLVLRFDYRQVISDPDSVVAAVRAIVDAGLHLWSRG